MRPPQTPRNELADKEWQDTCRWMRKQFAMLFFQWDQLWGLVTYRPGPEDPTALFIGGFFRDPEYPRAANDNPRWRGHGKPWDRPPDSGDNL